MRYIFLSLFVFLFFSSEVRADKISDIKNIENYLQQLKTMKARFIQTAPDGSKTSGIFYLERPGKMRFEYDPPIDDFIVANGKRIYFYDAEMQQQSNVAIGETLADFILRENIKLAGDIKIVDIKNKKEGTLNVTLTQRVDPEAGAITLIFDKNPIRLKKWVIFDAQGLTTEISLWEIETNIVFKDKNIFRYIDPKKIKPTYND